MNKVVFHFSIYCDKYIILYSVAWIAYKAANKQMLLQDIMKMTNKSSAP